MSRVKNPKYESMSLEELKANMEKRVTVQGLAGLKKTDGVNW